MRTSTMTRRTVLLGAAVGAATVTLTACGGSSDGAAPNASASNGSTAKGSATEPLATPATLRESPKLTAQVEAGKLPALEKRIPANPYVIPHRWVQRGSYGGDLTMLVSSSTDASIGEWFYGHSILRFLNDSRDIGPGLAQSWESNADQSQWTFHFRKGLKWSDGQPWTTADIMFWWNDMAKNADYTPESVPDECKSAKGTVATFTAVDDVTLRIDFDTPAPLTPYRVAAWVNAGIGPSWMAPKHYVKQFHPRYNKAVAADWVKVGGLWESKAGFRRNPACPTMTGFRLTSYNEGKSLRWERNPYYYAVTADGDQLPYIDRIIQTVVQDPQVGKIQITAGKVDISHGPFNQLQLSDMSLLTRNKDKAKIETKLWDTGTGTASMVFLSQDYIDPDYRKLFREPTFRQALSHAFNRAQARKAIYFEQGEPTTGTLSPKGVEFVSSDEGQQQFLAWRDSYVAYDPEKAKGLLDKLGVVDSDGDGKRNLPGGKKLKLRIDLPGDAGDEHVQKDTQLIRDWGAIGLDVALNRVAPTTFDDNWKSGRYMLHSNWEASGPPNSGLINPLWLAPTEPTRWAPLQGAMYGLRGTEAEKSELDVDPYKRHPPRVAPEKGGPVERLWDLIDRGRLEADAIKRQAIYFELVKIHISDGPFFQGTVANVPVPVVHHRDLRNVPARENLALQGNSGPWEHPTPAVYDPEAYFWGNPGEHVLGGGA
jgi:peptide/nickel transport system substrate-binding protein